MLIVEDIIDSGLTLSYLLKNLRTRKPGLARDLRPAHQARHGGGRHRLPLRRLRDPDKFVVGFGLDFAEHYRTLDYIGVLTPEEAAEIAEPGDFSAVVGRG